MLFDLIYIIIGISGGLVVAFLGAGSSLIILPVLIILFPNIFPNDIAIKMATGTCMATITVAAISGALSQRKHINVDVKLCLYIGTIYLFAGFSGAFFAHYLSCSACAIGTNSTYNKII